MFNVISSFQVSDKLDNAIALHQRKQSLLEKLKQGYLQKLFPQKGQRQPELRFSGFTDDWEQRKLKDLGKITTGNTPSSTDIENYSTDGTIWITPTDINGLITRETVKRLSPIGFDKSRIVPAGSILVTCIASIGKNTLVVESAGFNQQINALTPTAQHDSYFLLTESLLWSRYLKTIAAAGTMQIVNKSEFENFCTYTPNIVEERKIGAFFKKLDDAIALHQQEIDRLQQLKQGYLQKMFV